MFLLMLKSEESGGYTNVQFVAMCVSLAEGSRVAGKDDFKPSGFGNQRMLTAQGGQPLKSCWVSSENTDGLEDRHPLRRLCLPLGGVLTPELVCQVDDGRRRDIG